MRRSSSILSLTTVLVLGCVSTENKNHQNIGATIATLASIEGKPEYLSTPFVTAGDRVYMIGFQDGSFPDLGWHITGEMGGIWDHPIKLMDGFTVDLVNTKNQSTRCLDKADQFTNYPMANRHHFSWPEENMEVSRYQFVPDGAEGLVVEFDIKNNSQETKQLQVEFTGLVDLRPTWLGDRTNMHDNEDEVSFTDAESAALGKDKGNPWYTLFGSSLKADSFSKDATTCIPASRNGLGKNGTLIYTVTVRANESLAIPFFIAGSYESEEAVRSTYLGLKEHYAQNLHEKMDRYEAIHNTARLTIPDKKIQLMYEWLKYNTDWLIRSVPGQGTAISAGLPDYPWWFGADAAYTLQGVLATGNPQLAKSTIELLHEISQRTNGNGRIIHEVSTNGAVYNPGNVNETAQFISLVNTYYNWTGDKELVTQIYPDLKKGLDWLLHEKDPDGNGYPNGSGMMEIPGLESDLEMIDVAVYTQQALASAAQLARVAGDTGAVEHYQQLADNLKVKINKDWWQPRENSFGDFRGTVSEAMPIIAAALIRADTLGKTWSVADLKQTQMRTKTLPKGQRLPHVIYHNWVVNTPLETGVADPDKGKLALVTARRFENPFGVFVTGIDRTEEPDSAVLKSRKKTFSYIGAVMTLPTGVEAVAASRYGTPKEVLEYLTKLSNSFSYALPGSMYEVSPDFGMITQAWNIYGVAVPMVQYFFGIQPKAGARQIDISPHLPAEWPEASLENIVVGNDSLDIAITKSGDQTKYHIQQSAPDWKLRFDIGRAHRVVLNEKEVDMKPGENWVQLEGQDNTLVLFPK